MADDGASSARDRDSGTAFPIISAAQKPEGEGSASNSAQLEKAEVGRRHAPGERPAAAESLCNKKPSTIRFAVPGESFGLTPFLRFSDRCSNPAMPYSATGSGIAGFRIAPERAPAGARAHS